MSDAIIPLYVFAFSPGLFRQRTPEIFCAPLPSLCQPILKDCGSSLAQDRVIFWQPQHGKHKLLVGFAFHHTKVGKITWLGEMPRQRSWRLTEAEG